VSESSLNGFPSSEIAAKVQTDPYRFLICADKFQTGYDVLIATALNARRQTI